MQKKSLKQLSKTEAIKEIQEFFSEIKDNLRNNIKNKTPEQVKKIKTLAMKHNLKLGANKKLFCKRCFSVYKHPEIRINKKTKSMKCENCGTISRWKMD
ncbi:MAG TPA: hypothetical protein PLK34_00865 [Candidatus Pacearchaeota archaeon]|nr:hypothetical protein [Candidatus Pacearchaeota archaeon]